MRKSEKATTRNARDAAGLQAQLTESWGPQVNRAGETYGRLFAAMREEFTGLVQRRLDANMTTMRAWSECRTVNDALSLQQSWLQSAFEHYVDHSNRIIETCRLAAADVAEAAQTASEAEKPAAERKATSHRHGALDIKEAA